MEFRKNPVLWYIMVYNKEKEYLIKVFFGVGHFS